MFAERRENAGEIIVGNARPGRRQWTKPVDFHFFNLCVSVSLWLNSYHRDTETQRLSSGQQLLDYVGPGKIQALISIASGAAQRGCLVAILPHEIESRGERFRCRIRDQSCFTIDDELQRTT